jgi:hypothetical protein
MLLLKNACVMLYIITFCSYAQVTLEWAVRYNSPYNGADGASAIRIDDSGYVYVTGAITVTSSNYDYITIKYTPKGDTVWTRRWDNNNQWDIGWDLLVDNIGNVYVTGGSATLKYNSEGNLIWVFDNDAECKRIAMDNSGDIIVAGSGYWEYVTIKLTQSGEQIWRKTYNGPASNQDHIGDLIIDNNNDVIVTGRSRGVNTDYDIATIKYSGSTGDTLWLRRYNGPSPNQPYDRGDGITVDDSNNVYVAGWSDGISGSAQCIVIKYSPDGELLWERRFPPGGGYGLAGFDIINDPSGYIYAAARSHGNEDRLIKYDYKGNLIWTAQYPAAHLFATNPPRLALDKLGNVYMLSTNAEIYAYYVVLKYDSDGNQQWEYRYHEPPIGGTFSINDAFDIYVDSALNIYVAGRSAASGLGTDFDVLTLKLSQDTPTVVQDTDILPSEFHLLPAYPNPFNTRTNITFTLPQSAEVEMKIYNILGEEITILMSGNFSAGTHTIQWEAGDLPSGMYLCRLQTGNEQRVIKLLLMK